MNSVFSVDDFSDPFWAAPAVGMNRSQSEWALEKFLEEFSGAGVAIPGSRAGENVIGPSLAAPQPSVSKADKVDGDGGVVEVKQLNNHNPPPSNSTPMVPVDSDEYIAILKNKLHQACAAVALSRAMAVKAEGSSAKAENQALQSGSDVQGSSKAHEQGEPDTGISAVSTTRKKSGTQVRQTTSGSSREDSDDGELEGDTETTENMDPADAKRARRMRSNRESARRSRRRKQAHMNELEAQVKMAEETVKRVTGINPGIISRPNVPSVGMPFISSPLEASTGSVPLQPNTNQLFHQPVPSIPAPMHHPRLDSSFAGNNLVTPFVNPQTEIGVKNVNEPSALQHAPGGVQKHIGPGVSPCVPIPGWEPVLPHAAAENNKQS